MKVSLIINPLNYLIMNKKLVVTLTSVDGNVILCKDPARPEDVMAALQFLDETNELKVNFVACDEKGNTI